MSDLVFSPWPLSGHLVAPGSAEVIYLRRALFVMRGTFFNPLTEEQAALPRHRWVLVHSGEVFSEGNDSDADGISTIFEPTMGGPGPDDTWELMLVPLYDGHAESDIYAMHGEAWIDVEAGTWVHGDEVQTGNAVTPYGRHTPRKLLRIPLWSTRRKVTMGGGFAQSHPAAADFADTGELKTSELIPHGTRSDPWVIEVDHGWYRTHVQLRFYDHAARRERHLPQGPILRSAGVLSGELFGGSSVCLPDGSIYMLHARPEPALNLMVYLFDSPRFGRFKIEDDTLEEGGSNSHDMVGLLGTHYFLPWRWCSRGMEAWEGAQDATAELRKPFQDIRTKGANRQQPLCFHLDDVVPTTNSGQALRHDGTRVALLDHHLAIREPASNSHGPLPYSDIEVPRFPMRAEETIFVRGQGIEKMTRVLEYAGQLFEIRHSHVRGTPRQNNLVGARQAQPLVLAAQRDRSSIALVDTRYIPITVGSHTGKLAHVIVHVSCFINAPAADRVASDSDGTANEAQTEGVPLTEHLLHNSAKVWDQKHPAHGNPADKKDYVILPQAGMSDGATVLKIRHFFGSRATLERATLVGSGDAPTNIGMEVHPQAGRATGGDPMHLYLVYVDQTRAPPVDPHPDAERPYDFEPNNRTASDRPDQVTEHQDTITHELGHSMGLPDEYIERASPNSDLTEQLPVFLQVHPAYPYALAASSLMNGNYLPRLRYVWAQLATLHLQLANEGLEDDHWFVQQQPFFVRYDTGEHGEIIYDLPYEGITGAPDYPRWPVWQLPPNTGQLGLSTLNLFPARRDETLMGPGFTLPSAGILTEAFDGILVVTTKLWFTFDSTIDDVDDRWEVMTDLGLIFAERDSTPHFYIDTPGAATFSKVLVLFQPRFEYGPSPQTGFSGNTPAAKADADIEIIVRGNNGHARFAQFGSGQALVRIRDSDVGPWILRFSINPSHWIHRDNDDDIEAGDLGVLATWLGNQLGRGAGTIRSYGG